MGHHLVKAGLSGLMGRAWSLPRGRRHPWAHSLSWARSPSAENGRKEVAKWLRGDSLSRSSWPHNRDHRSREQQHQCQSPGFQQASEALPWASTRPHKNTSPSLSPPCPQCMDEQLHYSFGQLHLQPYSRNPGVGELAGCSHAALWCTLQDVPNPSPNQQQSVHPRLLQGKRSVMTSSKT